MFVGFPEEPNGADCSGRRWEPSPALCQHAVRETHPHLRQQAEHGKKLILVCCLCSLRVIPGRRSVFIFLNLYFNQDIFGMYGFFLQSYLSLL